METSLWSSKVISFNEKNLNLITTNHPRHNWSIFRAICSTIAVVNQPSISLIHKIRSSKIPEKNGSRMVLWMLSSIFHNIPAKIFTSAVEGANVIWLEQGNSAPNSQDDRVHCDKEFVSYAGHEKFLGSIVLQRMRPNQAEFLGQNVAVLTKLPCWGGYWSIFTTNYNVYYRLCL